MDVHENVILDLLPAVRGGHASNESRQLVEDYLARHPEVAQVAALMPTPDPSLELRALQRTRRRVGQAGWHRGLAIFFTLLPLSFESHGGDVRFLFADTPAAMSAMVAVAIAFWVALFVQRRRSALV
jgi:hypothetical protein